MWIRIRGTFVVVVAFLAFTSIAYAQEPTGPTYGGSGPDIDSQVERGQVAGRATGGGEVVTGTLPFTGLDLALALVGGLALVTVGLVTRRVARARSVAR